MTTGKKVARRKLSLLGLATELGNVSKARSEARAGAWPGRGPAGLQLGGLVARERDAQGTARARGVGLHPDKVRNVRLNVRLFAPRAAGGGLGGRGRPAAADVFMNICSSGHVISGWPLPGQEGGAAYLK